MDAYVIWFIVAIFFTVLEMFTSGFAVMCFGIGALLASVVSCFAGLNAQILAMVIGSALSFFLVRPIVLKFFSKREKAGASLSMETTGGRFRRRAPSLRRASAWRS